MENNNPFSQVPPVGVDQRRVSFVEAIERGFQNYVNFKGRASRSEYWWWALFECIVSFAADMISRGFGEWFTWVVALALLLPGLTLTWRRLHDIGKSGAWILLALIPIVGWIILLIWTLKPSEPTTNLYGEVPNLV